MAVKDFLFNSDFPTDQIVASFTSSIAGGEETKTIVHNLPFTPLLTGIASRAPDFSQCFDTNLPLTVSSLPYVQLYSDSTNILVLSSSDSVVYFKVFAFAPSDYAGSVPIGLATSKDNLMFNTDYNYLKLFASGKVTSTTTISHDLGYIPVARAWSEGQYETITGERYTGITRFKSLTTSSLTVEGEIERPVHYRIYYDEA